jgi:carbonic anhydrase/acetyltransferase-like protein (isoleucine patch superfamily)
MAIYQLGALIPNIHPDAYISPESTIIGNVTIGANSSVWPGVVIRGDNDAITIGTGTSVQDGTVLHADEGRWQEARESLAKAQATAPLLLVAEIQSQADAIEATQPYRFARAKTR